jgi:hypothetical protein
VGDSMSDSVVSDCLLNSILKTLLETNVISKEDVIKNYWEIRKTIKPGTSVWPIEIFWMI